MADYTLTMAAGDYSVTAEDGNTKVALDGADLKLQPDADVFGDSLDDWTEMAGSAIWSAKQGVGTESLSESDGILTNTPATAGGWDIGARRSNVSYAADGDVVFYCSDTETGTGDSFGIIDMDFWRNAGNLVFLRYLALAVNRYVQTYKVINGSATKMTEAGPLAASSYYFRIRRDAEDNGGGDNFFYFYTSSDGSSWTTRHSAQVRDATHFSEAHALYPIIENIDSGLSTSFSPSYTHYYQYTGDIAAQVFWPDSPEATLIESGQTYAFDAGAGNVWALTGASSNEDGDGGTVKYKGGYSDDGSTITWVDVAWSAIATINTNAGNGDYDGHRYLHFKAQFNSDGTQAPNLTDFTVSGTAGPAAFTLEQSSTEAIDGTYSLKIMGPVAGQADRYLYQYIDTEPGVRYYCSAWAYCTVAPTTGNFYVQAYDQIGSAVIEQAKVSSTTSAWSNKGFHFTAPASCVRMTLRVGGNVKGGTIYWDGVDVQRCEVKDYP
jgi:hypothetical protein